MKNPPEYLVAWIRSYFGEDAIEDDAVDVTIEGIAKMVGRLRIDGDAAMETLARVRAITSEWLSKDECSNISALLRIVALVDLTGGTGAAKP